MPNKQRAGGSPSKQSSAQLKLIALSVTDPQQMVPLDVVSQRLCTPITTVREWIDRRLLTSHKLGKRILVKLVDLDAFIEAGCRPALPGAKEGV